jgi:inosine-uridine nucleoside N-ribohydrolase
MGSDVDDALALAYCLKHPDIDLVAITTVADDVVERAKIAWRILRSGDRTDIQIAPGIGWEGPIAGRKSWFGHEPRLLDGDEPSDFPLDGVNVLLEATQSSDVEVATIGMQSNVAAAIERDGTFVDRVKRLDVMGGVFAPVRIGDMRIPPSYDHNLVVDPESSLRSLNAGMPTLYLGIDVTVHARLLPSHVEELRSGDQLCQEIARQLDIWAPTSHMPEGVAAVLHDPLLVSCIVERRFVTSEIMPITVAMHEGAVRTFIDPVEGQPAEVITSVDGDAFANHFVEVVLS